MIKKYEKQILESFLNLPTRKLLRHQFEIEEDYLAGYVLRFLQGERFEKIFIPYSNHELETIMPLIENNINNNDGKDLFTAKLLTELVCNIMNKYRK